MNAPVTSKHTFGWDLETTLLPIIQMLYQEEFEKTGDRFDEIDFVSATRYLELKGRREWSEKGYLQAPELFESWIVPADKVENKDKPVTVLYYWEVDRSLWSVDYDPEVWKTFNRGLPHWKNSQIHYWVPRDKWTKIFG